VPVAAALVLASVAAVEQPPAKQWYGYQVIGLDAAAIGMGPIASNAYGPRPMLSGAALALYGLGAPFTHWAHGNAGRGAISLGLRATLPLGLAFGMCEALRTDARAPADNGCAGAAALGAVIGVSIASVIDASALAYAPAGGPRLFPAVSARRGGGTVGVGGTF